MKKMSSLFCVMCLVLTGIWVLPVFGEDEQNSNNDVQPMGSRSILWVGSGQTYSNIQDAINVSKNGDTIRVTNGTFNQNLLINKSITIIGNGYYNTVVNGQGFAPVAKIVANWVNISGMQFTNNDVYSYPGIVIDKSDNCKIEDCNITGNSDGIEVLSSNNTIITNIEVDSNTFRRCREYDFKR